MPSDSKSPLRRRSTTGWARSGDRPELLRRGRLGAAGVVDGDDLAGRVDERTAGVARLDRRVVLERVVDRGRAGEVAGGLGLGDDAARQRELGIAERIARRVDIEPGADVPVEPLEVRHVVGAVDVDERQVVALRHAQDRGVVALVELAADVDLERRRAGHDVVVRDGEAVGADDEAAAEAGPSAKPISGSRNVPWATICTTAGWTAS